MCRWLVFVIAAAALAGCGGSGGDRGCHKASSAVSAAGATTYYVDAARGRDANGGASPATAWRTLARVERDNYRGGDTILLRGGESFRGTICLDTANLSATSQTSRLTIGSYGGGRATILAPHLRDGIAAINVAGVRVSGVNVVGHGDRCREDVSNGYRYGTAGIRLEADGLHGTLAQGISIDHVDVSGFCNGIVVASEDDGSRISHVRVTSVKSYDNGDAGVWTYDQANKGHSIGDVTVTNTWAYHNAQGGIVLFGVDGGVVENSAAFANGREAGGGVGIWAFDSNGILFAHNESYANGSATLSNDGDGFDFDQGVSNSVMEDNYSHDNGGVGILVCSCGPGYYSMHHNIIRFNVSRNDGSSGQPSLYVEGGEEMTDIDIVSNRVVSATGSGPLVTVSGNGHRYARVHFRGNRFVAGAGKPLLQVDTPALATDLVFQGNSWRAMRGQFIIEWGSRRFMTSEAWRAATGD